MKPGELSFKEQYNATATTKTTTTSTDENIVSFHSRHITTDPAILNHEGGTKDSPKTIYFIKHYAPHIHHHHRILQIIPDWETFRNLGFTIDDVEEMSSNDFSFLLSSHSSGGGGRIERIERFPLLHVPPDPDHDEVFHWESFKARHLQGINMTILADMGEPGDCNPSLLLFQDRFLVATQVSIRDRKGKEEIFFRWWNHPMVSFPSDRSRDNESVNSSENSSSNHHNNSNSHSSVWYLGVNERKMSHLLSQRSSNHYLYAQDPRMILLNDHQFYMVFTNPFAGRIVHMGLALLGLDHNDKDTGKEIKILSLKLKIVQNAELGNQKNWSPFFLPSDNRTDERDLYFVQYINPFTVFSVKYSDVQKHDVPEIPATLVSRYPYVWSLQWKFGDLRGGTPPIYLPRHGVFLAFFHSQTWIHKSYFRTYTFGAYTFTATPPFRLTSYTMYPIWDDQFYDGPFHFLYRAWHVDFVVFPTSAFLKGEEGEEEVIVTLGHQDERGYVAKINLNQLLLNMAKVEEEEKEEESKKNMNHVEQLGESAAPSTATVRQRTTIRKKRVKM